MKTERIEEALRLYKYICANHHEGSFQESDPIWKSHIDTLRAMSSEERTEYQRQIKKIMEENLQDIRDNIIFTVPKGFWKKD